MSAMITPRMIVKREMFPAQTGRPRRWHDLREGVRDPSNNTLEPTILLFLTRVVTLVIILGIFLIPKDRVCSRTAEYSQPRNKIWNTLGIHTTQQHKVSLASPADRKISPKSWLFHLFHDKSKDVENGLANEMMNIRKKDELVRNEYDDYSEDDCKREMFPAQTGRPRRWHDLREGVRTHKFGAYPQWRSNVIKVEINPPGFEWFREFTLPSNIKFRIVERLEDELLKREIVREEGIHFSDSWTIELEEISGNSTRVTVTEKLMFYTTIYVYHILNHVAKSVCLHVAKPIQLIKKTIVPIVCICNDINA
ncbi:unnamed protein product [Rhizophagus irregularis]|nr:unnamed protein product [Rhizophagus irregularis]